jgi:hypothetical protein
VRRPLRSGTRLRVNTYRSQLLCIPAVQSPNNFAMAAAMGKRHLQATIGASRDDGEFVRKKLKLADLPITAHQRNTIDGLLHTFTKKGEFDKLRKSIFAKFEQSVNRPLIAGSGLGAHSRTGCKDRVHKSARRAHRIRTRAPTSSASKGPTHCRCAHRRRRRTRRDLQEPTRHNRSICPRNPCRRRRRNAWLPARRHRRRGR